ncbi:MAG TPA: hypothetical protein VLB90_08320 [Pseudomonadales bacterium]|nr:hypothetical protein [Pseudomonadales bacterium]
MPINKAEFILENSGQASGQSAVANNGSTRFLSVWYKNNEIWGQYSERGNLIGAAFPVASAASNIDTTRDLRLLMNASGNAVALWVGSNHKLYAQQIPADSNAGNLMLAPIVASLSGDPADVVTEVSIDPVSSAMRFGRDYSAVMDDAGNFYTASQGHSTVKFDASGVYQGLAWRGNLDGMTCSMSAEENYFASLYTDAPLTEASFGTGKQWVPRSSLPIDLGYSSSNSCYSESAINSNGNVARAYIYGSKVYVSRINVNGIAATDLMELEVGKGYTWSKSPVRIFHTPVEVAVAIDENDNISVAWISLEGKLTDKFMDTLMTQSALTTVINTQAYVDGQLTFPKTFKTPNNGDIGVVGATLAKKTGVIFNNLRMASNNTGGVALTWTENKYDPKQASVPQQGVVKSTVVIGKYTTAMKPVGGVVTVAKASKAVGTTPNYVSPRFSDIAIDNQGSIQVNWEKLVSTAGVETPAALARFYPGKGVK